MLSEKTLPDKETSPVEKSRGEMKLLKEQGHGGEVTAKSRHRWMSLWVDINFCPYHVGSLQKNKKVGAGVMPSLCLQPNILLVLKKKKNV